MEDLRRITLLVGRNNIGKTSLLEAVYLLATAGDPTALWRVLMRRGEQAGGTPTPGRAFQPEVELRHLFHGHDIRPGTLATISTYNEESNRTIQFEIVEADEEADSSLLSHLHDDQEGGISRLVVKVTGSPQPLTPYVPINGRGGLRQDTLETVVKVAGRPGLSRVINDQFVTTESLAIQEIQAAFNEISLATRAACH